MMTLASAPTVAPAPGNDLFKGFGALSRTLGERLKDSGLDNLVAGVKNFLPAQKDETVTRLVKALMEPAHASAQARTESDKYLYLDPKRRNPDVTTAPAPQAGGGHNEGVVFVVGGGSYVEYANLREYEERTATSPVGAAKKIIYGATEILSPKEFCAVLARMAQKN